MAEAKRLPRTEAAQALFEAAKVVRDSTDKTPISIRGWFALNNALDAYRDSIPDTLPAEVARVLEAAGAVSSEVLLGQISRLSGTTQRGRDALDALTEALDAYRSSQPEPLSTRLARLKPGSVVEDDEGDAITVLGVDASSRRLFGAWTGKRFTERCTALFHFDRITAILSESP